MIDASEMHRFTAARTHDPVSVHNAPDALAEGRAAFRTPHPHFHVVDRIVHGSALIRVLLGPPMMHDRG